MLTNTGKLYAEYVLNQSSPRNAIAAIDPTTTALKHIVTGYVPFAFALNNTTDRVYVADQRAPEVLVLKGSDHSSTDAYSCRIF